MTLADAALFFFQGAPPPGQWMPIPQAPVGCPPGLEYLAQIDQLLVKQQVELLEGKKFIVNYLVYLVNY